GLLLQPLARFSQRKFSALQLRYIGPDADVATLFGWSIRDFEPPSIAQLLLVGETAFALSQPFLQLRFDRFPVQRLLSAIKPSADNRLEGKTLFHQVSQERIALTIMLVT